MYYSTNMMKCWNSKRAFGTFLCITPYILFYIGFIMHMRSNNDPITGLKDRIVHAGMATEEELKEIEKLCRKFVDEAVEVAKAGKQPDVKELWTDIYTPGSEPKFIRGRTSFEGKSFLQLRS